MTKITRIPIKLLARHSDWQPEDIDEALNKHVRADAESWRWLLRMLLPALGIGFIACGVLFFFAYNWADIPKFGKLGIALAAVIIPCFLSLVPSFSALTRKILLTAAAFLVGPLFGVFGQIYQTGANAYDLFFGWTLFVLVWVVVANFAPLWLLFLALLNVSVSLYSEQVASGWSYATLTFILFAVNTLAAAAFLILDQRSESLKYPAWLPKVVALAAACFSINCCCVAIMEMDEKPGDLMYLIPALVTFGLVAWWAIRKHELYYLTLLTLAIIAIVATVIIRFDLDMAGFLMAALWVVGGTTGSTIVLNNFRKAWRHD